MLEGMFRKEGQTLAINEQYLKSKTNAEFSSCVIGVLGSRRTVYEMKMNSQAKNKVQKFVYFKLGKKADYLGFGWDRNKQLLVFGKVNNFGMWENVAEFDAKNDSTDGTGNERRNID